MSFKILFLSHKFYPDIGGIEVNSEILATAFQRAGHEVILMTWTEKTGGKNFPFSVIRKPGLQSLFKHHKWADIVFENNPCLRLAWPGIFFKKPYVVALRTWVTRMTGELGFQDKIKIKWIRRAAAVIAVSDAVRRKSWSAAIVIGNPYRNNLFKVCNGIPRKKNFAFLGRVVSDKGADIAIKAVNKIKQLNLDGLPNLSFTIIGDGDQIPVLKELVNRAGLNENVFFAGSLSGEELVKCLNEHQYLLVPSVWEEPFGNVALEGMACGCIPIVSDGGGLPDAVGDAGLTFKRGSVDDLANTILSVVQNPILAQKLRDVAPKHLEAHLPEVVACRYLKVLENVLAGK